MSGLNKQGYTLTEVMVALLIMIGLVLSVTEYLAYAQQNQHRLSDIRLAHQLLINTSTELAVTQGYWNSAQAEEWQQHIKHYLPTAQLTLQPQQLSIMWPNKETISIGCKDNHPQMVCVGMSI